MSSQRGNVKKSGPPKYRNKGAFKNDLHDKSKGTAALNKLQIDGCCAPCEQVLRWKIKYRKYKTLSQCKKCVKCEQKTVKDAYYTTCLPCALKNGTCAKCCKSTDLAKPSLSPQEEARQQSKLEGELKMLTERQRRSFHRMNEKGLVGKDITEASKEKADTSKAGTSEAGACDISAEGESSEGVGACGISGTDSDSDDSVCDSAPGSDHKAEVVDLNCLQLDDDITGRDVGKVETNPNEENMTCAINEDSDSVAPTSDMSRGDDTDKRNINPS